MSKKTKPYECPRCYYTTQYSTSMHNHLYGRKKICPSEKEDVTLTDEIKETIMLKRIYHPPPLQPQQPLPQQPQVAQSVNINQHINTYHNVGNYINTMCYHLSDADRLSKFVVYNEKELISLDDNIETKYKKKVKMLNDDSFLDSFRMKKNDLFESVRSISTIDDSETYTDMNVLFNTTEKTLYILDDDLTWVDMRFEDGVRLIVEKLQYNYLDSYEKYLIKKLQSCNGFTHQQFKEDLKEYYSFIISFDLEPCCKKRDDEVLDNNYMRTYTMSEQIYPLYKEVEKTIKKTEITEIRKTIYDIIKKNCFKNLKAFYMKLYNLICKDENFKSELGITFQGNLPMFFLPEIK